MLDGMISFLLKSQSGWRFKNKPIGRCVKVYLRISEEIISQNQIQENDDFSRTL